MNIICICSCIMFIHIQGISFFRKHFAAIRFAECNLLKNQSTLNVFPKKHFWL